MKIINTENAEHYQWGINADGWHLHKSKSLSVIQEHIPPGESETRHYHVKAQQFFYVLSGVAQIEISGVSFEVTKGSGIHVPAQKTHQVRNASKVGLELLVLSEPMSHNDRVDS